MRLSLTKRQYDILLDEFLLSAELSSAIRRWPRSNNFAFKRHCFDYALSGRPLDLISHQSEYAITAMAKYFLTGYQLGVDIECGVSKRYKDSNKS